MKILTRQWWFLYDEADEGKAKVTYCKLMQSRGYRMHPLYMQGRKLAHPPRSPVQNTVGLLFM